MHFIREGHVVQQAPNPLYQIFYFGSLLLILGYRIRTRQHRRFQRPQRPSLLLPRQPLRQRQLDVQAQPNVEEATKGVSGSGGRRAAQSRGGVAQRRDVIQQA